jgi:hypothetical protein
MIHLWRRPEPPKPPEPVHLTDLQIEHGFSHEDHFGTEGWRVQIVCAIEANLDTPDPAMLA